MTLAAFTVLAVLTVCPCVDAFDADAMFRLADQRARTADAYSRRVRDVIITGRWSSQWLKSTQFPLAAGDILTPQNVSAAMEAVSVALEKNTLHGFGLRSRGEISILRVDVDFVPDPDPAVRDVTVHIKTFAVTISMARIGDNVLPIPRTPHPAFFEAAPKPWLALRPSLSLSRDRTAGTMVGASVQTNLLTLTNPGRIDDGSTAGSKYLDLQAAGARSLTHPLYRVHLAMSGGERRSGAAVQDATFRVAFDDRRDPQGVAQHQVTSGGLGGGLTFKLAANTRLTVDLGYRRRSDRTASGLPDVPTSANEQTNRVLLDAIPPRIAGFLRAAVWEDNTWLREGGSFRRLIGRIGYAKEIPVGVSQTLGVDIVAGGGRVAQGAPAYAHFVAGAPAGHFLYDGPSSTSLLTMPSGPILRSVGSVAGANTFWHLNANIAVPIPKWSRPLIPNELTDLQDVDGNALSIKRLMTNQINVSGPSMLSAVLKQQGMSDAEAQAKAKDVFAEIQPATRYIINDASLFSVKPLLMVDVAGMSDAVAAGPSAHWVAAGAGMQLTVVTAKFEIGYMRTVSGPSFGKRGTVSARLVFQNLF